MILLTGTVEGHLATLESVVRCSGSTDSPVVFGELRAVRELVGAYREQRADGPAVGELVGDPSRAPQLLLEAFSSDDLLIVSPGVRAVPIFDFRLAWCLESSAQLGAVAPLCAVDPLAEPGGLRPIAGDAEELDRRLADWRDPPVVDAPELPSHCFLLRRRACDDLDLASLGDFPSLLASLRRRGLVLGLVPHVVVGAPVAAVDDLRRTLDPSRAASGPASLGDVVVTHFRRRRTAGPAGAVRQRARPRVLHVAHSLGGGLDHWVRLFGSAPGGPRSWVLRSIGLPRRFGTELWLFDDPSDPRPRRTWKLSSPIAATAVRHLEYRRVLDEIVRELGIEAIVVSSLIGHSLDALRAGLPTAFVCHDYYPFCPALHIHFGGRCASCAAPRLGRCRSENPLGDLFHPGTTGEWLDLRNAFLAGVRAPNVRLVAPSPSVARNYRRLAPELAETPFHLVAHGSDAAELLALRGRRRGEDGPPGERRLRLVVLGRLSTFKGGELCERLLAEIGDELEVHLIGCGSEAARWAPRGVQVVADYERRELPGILARVDPDLALLPSIVPETYSFTLSECIAAGLPPLATRVGSFEDRIVDGETGFLVEPSVEAIAGRLRELSRNRERLAVVERRLATVSLRRPEEMVEDYGRLLELPTYSARAYFSPIDDAAPATTDAGVEQAWLPPRSPLGFRDFLAQAEKGIEHHIASSGRLAPWQKSCARWATRSTFAFTRGLMRLL